MLGETCRKDKGLMHKLLLFLGQQRPSPTYFQTWHIQKISGSANNLLYHATNDKSNLAIKFTIQDARRRAYREYQALLALQEVAPELAPRPILLDETNYPLPVVVQSWVSGEVTAVPPQSNHEWQLLVQHYATLATLTPEKINVPLKTAVMAFSSIPHAHQQIQHQLDAIPPTERPISLQKLMRHLSSSPPLPCPPAPSLSLCRNDSNTLNFIRRPNRWLSVDWENSGWGDPAFEIVDMICHPQYASVTRERWEWVIKVYGELVEDETAVSRIHTYIPLMYAWWVARLARAAYQVPRGLDERLVKRPSDWQAQNQALYARYLKLATEALNRIS